MSYSIKKCYIICYAKYYMPCDITFIPFLGRYYRTLFVLHTILFMLDNMSYNHFTNFFGGYEHIMICFAIEHDEILYFISFNYVLYYDSHDVICA